LIRHRLAADQSNSFHYGTGVSTMARLQVRVNDQQKQLVDRLRVLCGLKTETAVVENALMLLAWAAAQSHRGLAIASVDVPKKRYDIVHIPALEGARLMGELKVGNVPADVASQIKAGTIDLAEVGKSRVAEEQKQAKKKAKEEKLALATTTG